MNIKSLAVRYLILTLALAPFFLLHTAFATEPPTDPNGQRPLDIGETLVFDKGLRITFLAVKNDSRCPINARCISAGNATVVLRIKTTNEPARNVRLHTNRKPRVIVLPTSFPPGMTGIPKSYIISIGSLTPQPSIGRLILQKTYQVVLDISVAQ